MTTLAGLGTAELETSWGLRGEDGDADEAAAPADWNGFLHEFGAKWNRDDASWAQFREWFTFEATSRGLATEAAGFIAYAESTGQAKAFEEYGVPGAPAVAAAEEPTPVDQYPAITDGDSGDWVAHLDQMLTRAGY
jgi:hypothetical protein